MASNISFNPYSTTNALGSFSVQSEGLVQGAAYDDPAIRNALAGGTLAQTETLPMYGGIAIFENIPGTGSVTALGGNVGRATSLTNLTGFSVLNQAHNWVTSPQSQAPSAGAGMFVPFYRLGSGARIAVAMDPSLIGLNGSLITTQVSWDFFNQRLQAYDAATPTVAVTSVTSSFANGVYTFAVVAAAATTEGGVGDAINISGVTGTGANLVNGNQIITSFTNNQNFSFQVVAASGAIATGALTGTILLNYGTGALPVKVLETNVGNSKVIAYDAVNNYVNWNNSGAAAIILI